MGKRTKNPFQMRRLLALLLVLMIGLTTVVQATTGVQPASPETAPRLTLDNVWDIHLQDTFFYPEAFVYNLGRDGQPILDELYDNYYKNMMLMLASRKLNYRWMESTQEDWMVTITPEYFDTAAQRVAVREHVEETAAVLFSQNMTDLERLKAVNRYLVDNYEYDLGYNIYSAYPFIEQGKGVCQSYTQLGVMLLLAGGMDAHPITGISNGEAHSWIGVKVDGVWYEFDPTYNDPVGYQQPHHTVEYLTKTRQEMLAEGRTYDRYLTRTYSWISEAEPEPEPTPTEPVPQEPTLYQDVSRDDWFYEEVAKAAEYQLMIGTGAYFLPNQHMTLAQLATVAARASARTIGGEAQLEAAAKAYQSQGMPWYQAYVEYCETYLGLDFTDLGTGWEQRFAMREELAYLLDTAGRMTYGLTPIRQITIPDKDTILPEYVAAVQRMVNAGVINGVDANGTFAPKQPATRAQVATMLVRLVDEGERIQ